MIGVRRTLSESPRRDDAPTITVNVHSLLQQEQRHGAIGIGTSNGA